MKNQQKKWYQSKHNGLQFVIYIRGTIYLICLCGNNTLQLYYEKFYGILRNFRVFLLLLKNSSLSPFSPFSSCVQTHLTNDPTNKLAKFLDFSAYHNNSLILYNKKNSKFERMFSSTFDNIGSVSRQTQAFNVQINMG